MIYPRLMFLFSLITFISAFCSAQTSFSYQGQLQFNGTPANTSMQLRFQLFDSLSGGVQVGSTIDLSVTPSNGLFTVSLDFGTLAFTGPSRYLQVTVNINNGATLITLAPRQKVTPTPYSIYSYSSAGLTLPATQNAASASTLLTLTNTNSAGKAIVGRVDVGSGLSYNSASIWGDSNTGTGLVGSSNSYHGIYGYSQNEIGVYADGYSYGVYGNAASQTGAGVSGSGVAFGVFGVATGLNQYGVYGTATNGSTASGVYGSCFTGYGVHAEGAIGLNAVSTNPGGRAIQAAAAGNGAIGLHTTVNGSSTTGVFLIATGQESYAIEATASGLNSKAAYFSGNVSVVGTLSKSAGTFMIDHPLDPSNRFLYHSFVESPDMMNIYNGNITTDSKGEAWVEMPSYFEALNQDFRYQLTILDETQFAQARISKEIHSNRFQIKTDKPGIKVSWMVTGVRHDAFANAHRVVAEVDKAPDDKGKYLHPVENGQPETLGINYERDHPAKQMPK